jgi:lipopolysaccharide transport system ATP-binding protein
MERAPGNDLIRLRRLNVWPEGGGPSDPITMETPFVIDIEFWNLTPDLFLDVRIHLFTEYDIVALGADTSYEEEWHGRQFPVGVFRTQCHIPGNWLNAGSYRVAIEVVKDGRRKVYVQDSHFLSFDISELGERGGTWFGKQKGIFRPQLEWKTDLLGTDLDATPDLQLVPESQASY